MTFENNKAIYEQMADRLCDEIIAKTYKADDRIPSVREYAVTLQVNTNTAVKAYELLAREQIIYNKRGMGYFVSAGAREQIMQARRKTLCQQTHPTLFREKQLLGFTMEEVVQEYKSKAQS